jgi:hypothetical protein
MDRASTRDRLRAHCGAVCEAVLASVACVKKRSQTATKIFSDDRPPARRLSIVEIAPFALSNDRCIASAAELSDRGRHIARRCVSQREGDSFRTKSHTSVFAAVFNRVDMTVRFALDTAVGVDVTRAPSDSAGGDQTTNTTAASFFREDRDLP